ncbi:MAG TPA: TonB-dependent receptor, partial [Acidobacteriaceae bacterium]|nr:TonB-dependent receptor [Acidobacteriaceae bacterium]
MFKPGRILLLVLLSALPLCAQTPDTAALRGVISGPNDMPLQGVTVSIEDAQKNTLRSVQTDEKGTFAVEGLPTGVELHVISTAPGMAEADSGNVVLTGDETATLNLRMAVAGVQTRVVVTGTTATVETDEPQLGDYLTGNQAREMPLLNRRVTYLPLLNATVHPAINQGDVFMNQDLFTANGTGRRQTWFEVDGANAIDAWGRQTIFTNVPLDAVSGVTVLENAFAADYGFGEGAVVNLVMRTGTEQYHGDVLGLWRPSGPEAKLSGFSTTTATSGNDVVNDTLDQGAATALGPVPGLKATQFLASGEYSYQDRASPVISPLAPGNYVGHYRDWLGLLRIDHTISEAQHVFLHAGADAFFDTNPNGIVGGNTLPSVARVFHRRTYTAELGDTLVLSPTLENEARLQFQLASPITQFSPVIYGTEFSVPISTGGTFTSGTSQAALLLNRQFEAVDTLAKTWSRNELRAGFDVIHARNGGNSKEFGGPIYLGELVYKACPPTGSDLSLAQCEGSTYLDNIDNVQSYTQSYGNASYVVDDTLAGVFVQDDAHVTPDLTLNVGLRYEIQTFTDARTNLAPRAGFAYNLLGRGTTTVRGGFGLYYSQIVDNSEANYALTGPTGVF